MLSFRPQPATSFARSLSTPSAPNPIKFAARKLGRPRKEVEVDEPRRPRGRPRKDTLELDSDETLVRRRRRAPKDPVLESSDSSSGTLSNDSLSSVPQSHSDNIFDSSLGLDGVLKHPAALTYPMRAIRKDKPLAPRSKLSLPPLSEWRNHFPSSKGDGSHRISLCNPESAYRVADSFVPKGSRDKVIIEAFPGPGVLTRALLQLPKERIRRLIVLEDWKAALEYLTPLEQADPRVRVLPMNGFYWSTYRSVEDLDLLEGVSPLPWNSGPHPELQFISQLEHTTHGEQLITQLFRSIPEQSWLFRYGRIPMGFLLNDRLLERFFAGPLDTFRGKVSLIAEATAEMRVTVTNDSLLPLHKHFYPALAQDHGLVKGRNIPLSAVTILPHEKQIIQHNMLDKWDYCLRRLFVLKSTPLKTAIGHLGAGAQILLKTIDNPDLPPKQRVDVNKTIRRLELHEWATLIKAFDEWPFAPDQLMVGDVLTDDRRS